MKAADSKAREALAAAVAAVRESLKSIVAEAANDAEDAKAIANLREEIPVLKATLNPRDVAAIQRLRAKQDELDLRRERQELAESAESPLLTKLRGEVEKLVPLIRAVAQPLHKAVQAEIMALMAPYLERDNDSAAEFFAANCIAVLKLGQVLGCGWQNRIQTAPVSAAEAALRDADALLSGERFWLRSP